MIYVSQNSSVSAYSTEFWLIIKKAKSCGAMISVHAENKQLIDVLTERYLSEGKTSAWYHYMSRPEFVEGEADIRAIQLAKSLDSKLYIVHLANKEGEIGRASCRERV